MSAGEDPGQEATRLLGLAGQRIAEGQFADAINLCRDAAALVPHAPQPYHGMSAAFIRLGDIESALAAIAAAAKAAPEDPTYLNEWARLLVSAGRDRDADEVLNAAAHVVARDPTVMNLWGLCLCRLGRYEDAAVKFRIYLEQDPDNRTVHRNLSLAYQGLGQMERAVDAFSASAAPFDPDAPPAPSDMKAHFADVAPSYDDNDLNTGIARRMMEFIEAHAPVSRTATALDCCCGSGLAAAAMPGRFARLVGIDLSEAMLEGAERNGAYDVLIQGDMVQEMAKLDPGFDLVFASNALMYFQTLDGFFNEAHRLLEPGGYLVFSADPSNDAADIRCVEPGEYAHSRAYLRRLAAAAGFAEVTLQIKEHRAYPGFWGAFRKPAPDT